MNCDWWHQCVRNATTQVVLQDTDGSQQTQYYCPIHLQMRLAEIQDSDYLELQESRPLKQQL
ncbi:hypothetical protein Htur_4582 (plasmid) [Haloterrigena turkmenica DSM 5511]|uniref:Uncharacterized protein n=1 Tax=Haloterrigena turkmenica (strain ATCC 51198 / DSM 5511 / JCM 9101 / NCIMB 13204 / VKM B-1734 / 4k) TaxID=543526 RepID=D2S1X6_HALTV|nr:hypothetical protein Htur_4582 [Haloterrigena turkmenica DSM 5511]